MNCAAEFLRCLIALDAVGIRDLWFRVSPHLPQPMNNEEALIALHHARTQARSVPSRLRCYSHSWLLERGLPSGLPDHLKSKAARLYPHRVEAVGVAVMPLSSSPDSIERARVIEQAMAQVVRECYADGERDHAVVKARMAEARRLADR